MCRCCNHRDECRWFVRVKEPCHVVPVCDAHEVAGFIFIFFRGDRVLMYAGRVHVVIYHLFCWFKDAAVLDSYPLRYWLIRLVSLNKRRPVVHPDHYMWSALRG